ncbi:MULTISPECIES: hypothetical protein [Streptomyces]|uniref:Uncharacterized protein n=1 Tax=Streptomyces cacaoi TaxID=1898 RepID=A0A4Y3RAC4_STRCI|nr:MULTISPECIES: hypothetical protein [Streptomyces]GEB52740.1 hypothetical protein SCA03_52910 [Streptomyces cacaoi]
MGEFVVGTFSWVARGVGAALDYLNLRSGVGTLTGNLRTRRK